VRDSHLRSVAKGVSWRTAGTADTILLSFMITGDIKNSLAIGLTEVFTKIFIYYLHERVWDRIPWGRIHGKGPTHGRSLVKGVCWRALGTLDTIIIAYLITGVPADAITIGGFELFTKIALFYVHERIWGKIWWGRIMDDNLQPKPVPLEVSSFEGMKSRKKVQREG
jgi:uncharacterized membrane protein